MPGFLPRAEFRLNSVDEQLNVRPERRFLVGQGFDDVGAAGRSQLNDPVVKPGPILR